jgi:hypothetical protein
MVLFFFSFVSFFLIPRGLAVSSYKVYSTWYMYHNKQSVWFDCPEKIVASNRPRLFSMLSVTVCLPSHRVACPYISDLGNDHDFRVRHSNSQTFY